MFICNAPFFFTAVWAIVKGFLDERTRNKIQMKGSGYKKELLLFVDAENLPDFLGGTCTCPDKEGCMLSNEGPWNDFESVKPYGIRQKSTGYFYNKEVRIEDPSQHEHADEQQIIQ